MCAMRRAPALLATLSTLFLLACDPDTVEPAEPWCAPDVLQHAPCDPNEDECGRGYCVMQASPDISWGCEMEEAIQEPGQVCERHEQCTSGLCMPEVLSPVSTYGAAAVCAFPCQVDDDCFGGSLCHPVGPEEAGIGVCALPL